ncbi:diphosphate--fructose-6-phosphate 1-phosphotransferase [Aeromicrobium sp. A1-2]|uniref:ATP-dependent 6-phosphofructokinase n=1 Tax=Aeromicrobium sp. A1-2 TaxID=2107713 RepID=UPI000E54465D|nr:ATP-dependent 6-phosphofructokinase [Aeromicrobium sp. A1-2]AXT86550.1 diphosphate--fructose-6-phosphate 1-phosphotransferase [Aeromicrobium sp. A1-2]
MVTLDDLQVRSLGASTLDSPLAMYVGGRETNEYYVGEDDRILYDDTLELIAARGVALEDLPTFESGGPRRKIFFDPATTRVGVVTCGGLCPGLNDVIRAIVLELNTHYGVRDVVGFQHGYAGLIEANGHDVVDLTPERVARINERGGTVLGSSRGAQDPVAIVDRLVALGIDILMVIGGDGSMRGAHNIGAEIAARGLTIGVVGVPKTIDNDIPHIGQSFGFATAFAKAAESIKGARVEVEAAVGGVGIVKVMGRHAGFIACYAALANHDADFVLIPEVEFALDGDNGLLTLLRRRVAEKGNAVIVLAEGAGQDLIPASDRTDASGNAVLGDIAAYLREQISKDFANRDQPLTMRYFNPGYAIRSVPADASDSVYCTRLAQTAVHAAMAGRTDMVVGRRRHRFVHVPIPFVTTGSHSVSPDGDLWLSVLESTAQPFTMS